MLRHCCSYRLQRAGGEEDEVLRQGEGALRQGGHGQAALELKNAIQIDPKFADAYYMLGMVELKRGNPKDAYGYLNKATQLAPDNMKRRSNWGGFCWRQGCRRRPGKRPNWS